MIEALESTLATFPDFMTKEGLVFYAINLVLLVMVLRTLKMIYVLVVNKYLSIKSTPYSKTGDGKKSILILGDSTAVGTGAEKNEDTIAGRLSHDFPDSQIINLGVDGSLIFDLQRQLKSVEGKRFDMVVISSGGNDIWSFSSIRALGSSLRKSLREAKEISGGRVIFLLYNSIDHAPIFPKMSLLRVILRYRCRAVQKKIRQSAASEGVPVIELFTEEEHNPFTRNPQELFAPDGIHPSSKGYATWYNRMWLTMTQNGYFYTDRNAL